MTHKLIKALNIWVYGGPYGGAMTHSYGISNGWSALPGQTQDLRDAVPGHR